MTPDNALDPIQIFYDLRQLIIGLSRAAIRQAGNWLPLAILLIAAAVRFHWLGMQSIWNDEGNSLRLAQRSIPALIAAAGQDIHPPGYYLALKMWIGLVGDSEFGLRALSAFAGLLTVAGVYALGRALFARGVGLIAAALIAVNSFEVYYSQEARMYAFLALWTALGLWLFVRWISAQPTRACWSIGLLLALINAAGLYTHYIYPLVMLVQGVLFLALWLTTLHRRFMTLIRYVAINALMLILFAPQLTTALHQITGWPHTGAPIAPLAGLSIVGQWLTYGSTTTADQWSMYFWPVAFILAALLPDWLRKRQPFTWRITLPWLLIITLVGVLFSFGLFREANLKFLIPAQIGAALLIGRGAWLLWEIGSPNLFILIEAAPRLIAIFGLYTIATHSQDALNVLYTSSVFARDNYRGIAQVIAADPQPGDRVLLDAPNQIEAFSYYYPGPAPMIGLPPGLGGDDAATRAALEATLQGAQHIYAILWGTAERDPQQIVEKTLSAETYPLGSHWYGNLRLAEFVRLPDTTLQPVTFASPPTFTGLISLQAAALNVPPRLNSGAACATDQIGVKLTWTALKPLATRYKVFVQLLSPGGTLIAQHDAEPVNDQVPTTSWLPNQPIVDRHGLRLPAKLPAGVYRLIIGLYDPNGPTRLTIDGAQIDGRPADYYPLGTVNVCAL